MATKECQRFHTNLTVVISPPRHELSIEPMISRINDLVLKAINTIAHDGTEIGTDIHTYVEDRVVYEHLPTVWVRK